MTQQFFFHDAATTVTGTLPGTSPRGSSAVAVPGNTTNRSADGTAGVSQVSQAMTTLAQTTAQQTLFRRFVSPLLAAQTVPAWFANTSIFRSAASQSNTASALTFDLYVYFWRPSTGAQVGASTTSQVYGGTVGTTETALSSNNPNANASSVSLLDGDVAVFEIWR